jgi:hypothetical protein
MKWLIKLASFWVSVIALAFIGGLLGWIAVAILTSWSLTYLEAVAIMFFATQAAHGGTVLMEARHGLYGSDDVKNAIQIAQGEK